MVDSIIYYKFSNTDQSLTGNFSFNQAAADDQQITLAEGLNISATYGGQNYTQGDDSSALLLTNQSGEIADQGLGLQFLISDVFTVNAEVFLDANTDQTITYTQLYAPTDLVFNTVYNFSNTDQSLTGNFSFNQAAADDQQITVAEGLNISATYGGQNYTQGDDSSALLLTNQSGEIADQGLGLQFLISDVFTVNAEVFFDANTDQTITYTLAQAPTNPELSAISIDENIASDTSIASFSTTDRDSATFTYTLVSGTGDIDNGAFTIDGNNLKINSSPNFETKSVYNIRVRTTDNTGLTFEKALTITVNDLNETPTDLTLAASLSTSVFYNFSSADQTVTGTISFNQAAAADQQVTIAEGLEISLTYNGQTYTETLDSEALLLTNDSGNIGQQGLGLQFVIPDVFSINAENFIPTNPESSIETITYTSLLAVDENVAAGASIATLSSTDQDANNTFTYSLVAGTGDADNAAFTIDGNNLKINSSPDFETKSVYNIRVRTTDNTGLTFEKALTITVNDLNETPTDLTLAASLSTSVFYNFSSADQTVTGTISFNQAAAADQQVTIAEGLEISLTYNGQTYTETLDSEALLLTNDSGNIGQQGLGLQFVIPDVFSINAENFIPTNPESSIETITYTSLLAADENVAAGASIGTLSSTDQDANNTFTYSLVAGTGDADNAAFTIDGNNLKINSSPDFETKSSYNIRLKTTDNTGLTFEKALTITVNDLNEAATNLALSATSVNENVSVNTIIGTFSSTEQDANNTFTYNLVSGTGDVDNAVFTIDGNNLKINSSPDFETKSTYNIRVKTTDNSGLIFEKPLTITVNDLNEAPTDISLGVTNVNENVSANTIIGTLSSIDPDANNTFTYSLVTGIDDTDNAAFTINGDKLQINSSPNFDIKSIYKIRVKTTDQSGLSFEKALNIGVNNIVIPPQLTKGSDDVFNIKGDNGKGKLKITIASSTPNRNQLSELGVFNVDDAAGSVKDDAGKSLLPGADGYAKAALARAKVLLSTIANLPNGFTNSDVVRSLQLDSDSNLRFYLVQGTTTQTVINKSSYSDVVFSSTPNIKDLGNNVFSLTFPNLVVNIQATNQSLDSGLSNQFGQQGSTKGELLYVNEQVNATFTVNREAAYDNFIGFYQVTDETGTINVNGTIYQPGDSGYTQAAINSRVVGLTGSNQATIASNGRFSSNSIFAPFIIANADPNTYISRGNSVYFSFLGANPTSDKQVDHIRLLGNNTFGFEDLANGGDQDFNDIIVRVNFS